MVTENNKKNINFIRIIAVLQSLRNGGIINSSEYARAKKYYQKLIGSDIIIAD